MAREKQVFDTGEIAHLWAHQRVNYARNPGGNFWFQGRTIYSYGEHFPIAVLRDGGKVLFTTSSYSNTTAKHIYYVSRAISHREIIYCKHPEKADKGEHGENIRAFEAQAQNWANGITPRTRKPEKYIEGIERQKAMFTRYCEFFDLDPEEQRAKYNLVYLYAADKNSAMLLTSTERERIEKERAEREKAREEQKKKDCKKDLATLRKWRAFDPKSSRQPHFITDDFGTYLRYNKEKKQVETSKGIDLPLDVANRFYTWFYKTLKGGGCTGYCNHEILGYRVQTANENGLRVGCHDISIDEITALAKELKWTLPSVAIDRCKLIKEGKAISLN